MMALGSHREALLVVLASHWPGGKLGSLWRPSGDALLCVVSCCGAWQASSVLSKNNGLVHATSVESERRLQKASGVPCRSCSAVYTRGWKCPTEKLLPGSTRFQIIQLSSGSPSAAYLEDFLLLYSPSRRAKAFSTVSTFLAEKACGAEGKWWRQVTLLGLACISGRGCKGDLMTFLSGTSETE